MIRRLTILLLIVGCGSKSKEIDNKESYGDSNITPGNIVMYHLGRCGSKVVGSMLSRTKNIYWSDAIWGKILKDLYIHINGTTAEVNIDVQNDNYGHEKYWRER